MVDALILVDIQNDFLPGGALGVPDGDQVVSLANRLAERFDLVVASQDWHPPDHSSFAVNHPGRNPGDVVEIGGMPQVLWPVHCVENTSGAEFAPGLDTSRISRVFRKGTDPGIDSYSAFFDNRRLKATGLGEFLSGAGVGQVYVAGLATDYCVRASALDARSLGFPTILIEDACRGVGLHPGDIAEAVAEMRGAGVEIAVSSGIGA